MTQAGIVYFMSEGPLPDDFLELDRFYIKIGWTRAKSARNRRAECQVGNPRPLEVIAEFSGSCLVENRFHRLFQSYRQQGEWFLLSAPYIRAILDFEDDNGQRLFEHLRAWFACDLNAEAC